MTTESAIISSKDPHRLTTPEARLSYPFIWSPRPGEKAGDPGKYQCTLIFKKPFDKKPFSQILLAAGIAAFGADYAAQVKAGTRGKPEIYDGDDPKWADSPELKGCVFIRCTTPNKPGIVDQNVQPIPALESDRVYAGCYVRAGIRAYKWSYGKGGIGWGLQNIQLIRDGEPFAGGARADEDFGPVAKPAGAAATAAEDDDLLGGAATGELADADLDL